jgi:hypothetical protein
MMGHLCGLNCFFDFTIQSVQANASLYHVSNLSFTQHLLLAAAKFEKWKQGSGGGGGGMQPKGLLEEALTHYKAVLGCSKVKEEMRDKLRAFNEENVRGFVDEKSGYMEEACFNMATIHYLQGR